MPLRLGTGLQRADAALARGPRPLEMEPYGLAALAARAVLAGVNRGGQACQT